MRALLTIGFITVICNNLPGQTNPDDLRNKILYSKEFGVGGSWTTNGWDLVGHYGKILDSHTTFYYEWEIQSLKDPREIKTASEYQQANASTGVNARSYVFGKQNSLIGLSAAVGAKQMLAERADKSGVELSARYSGGVTLGILKPYYLNLVYVDGSGNGYIQSQGYTAANSNLFLDPNYIYGYAGFSQGWSGIKFVPAFHLKAGLNVDWAHFEDHIASLEIGGQIEAFPKRVPVMIVSQNQWLWPSVYATLSYGKRW